MFGLTLLEIQTMLDRDLNINKGSQNTSMNSNLPLGQVAPG